jgi:hypothetical protein
MHHRDKFGTLDFSHNEWAADGGFGVKLFVTGRVFVSPEVRLGHEALMRFTGSIGFAF